MKFKKGLTALATSLVILSGGVLVNAGTTWSGYENESIPGNNGTAHSSSQAKAKTNASSDLEVTYTSNPNSVDARAIGGVGQGSGAWVRNVNTGSYAIPNPVQSGNMTQIEFSTDLFAATTALTHRWRSN